MIDAGVPTAYARHVQAIRAGDLLFLSGLMAVDSRGALAPSVRTDPRQPYFSTPATANGPHPAKAELCRQGSKSLVNVVAPQQFHHLADSTPHGGLAELCRAVPAFLAIELRARRRRRRELDL